MTIRYLSFFLFLSIPAFAQVPVETLSSRYESADSTFTLSFGIPVVKEMKDVKKRQRINDYIYNKIMYSDSAIHATLSESLFDDPERLDSLRTAGTFPHSYKGVVGKIELLTDRYLCLRVMTAYDYWGAAHSSADTKFFILDLKIFREENFKTFFNENGKRIFHKEIITLPGKADRADNDENNTFSEIVDLGISDRCYCEKKYCLLFFIEGYSNEYGYEDHNICLSTFKDGFNKGSVLYELQRDVH